MLPEYFSSLVICFGRQAGYCRDLIYCQEFLRVCVINGLLLEKALNRFYGLSIRIPSLTSLYGRVEASILFNFALSLD